MTSTGLIAFEPSVSRDMEQNIQAGLQDIAREYGVRILFAVESGSRAWGFPSPDSDFDVRFVYVHPSDWYLSVFPGRDVIELPIDGDLDINGWDLRKALALMLKPNPVLLEWLSSPIRYAWDDAACTLLNDFSRKVAHQTACLYHYLHLGRTQWQRHIGGKTEINYKKYFYVLRPALAIRWVRLQPDVLPPMNLQALVEGLAIDNETVADIARLLELKSRAKETGTGERIANIDRLICSEMDWAQTTDKAKQRNHHVTEADALFRRIVKDAGDG